jgi:hypothetical protein
MITRYVNTASTAGGDGTTNATVGVNRAYATLAEAATQMAALNAAEDVQILCCGASYDTSAANFSGVYVQSSYTLTIAGNPTDPTGVHPGRWLTGRYTVYQTSTAQSIRLSSTTSQNIIVRDIQIVIYIIYGVGINVTSPLASGSTVKNVLFNNQGLFQNKGMYQTNGYLRIEDCVFFNVAMNTYQGTIGIHINGGTETKIVNCSVHDYHNGIQRDAGNVTVKNSAIGYCLTNEFIGTMTIDHCASVSGVGTNPLVVTKWGTHRNWGGYAVRLGDYRINSGSALIGAGLGPDADPDVPTTDIEGHARSGLTATIGPYEQANTLTKLNFYVNTSSTSGGSGIANDTTGASRAFYDLRDAFERLNTYSLEAGIDVDIHCCGTIADGRRTNIANGVYTNSSSRTITIKGNRSVLNGYHGGKWNTGAYRHTLTDSNVLLATSLLDANKFIIVFDGLQFDQGTQFMGLDIGSYLSPGSEVKNCIIRASGGSSQLIKVDATVGGKFFIRNNVFQQTATPQSSIGIYGGLPSGSTLHIYNNVVVGLWRGVWRYTTGTVTAKNNSVFNNSDFDISTNCTVDHCATDDVFGTNRIVVSNWAAQFHNANYIADSDFNLQSKSVLLNAGIGPALDADTPATDTLEYSRSGDTATVGPFEHEVYIPHPLPGIEKW